MIKVKSFFRYLGKVFAKFFNKHSVKENLKFIGLLLLIYIVITLALRFIPFFQQYNTYTIRTDSMEPVLMIGDLIVVEDINPKDIKVGDIIAFHVDVTNDGEDDVIIHYIDEIINYDEDTLVYKSKPEISNLQDRWTIEEQDIIGIYAYKVENVGKMLLFLNSWIGRIILLVDIVLVWVIVDLLFGTSKKANKDKNLNNESAEKEEIRI
jgi:signal peptidase